MIKTVKSLILSAFLLIAGIPIAQAQSNYHVSPLNAAAVATYNGFAIAVWFDTTAGAGDVFMLGHVVGSALIGDVVLDGPADLATTVAHDGGLGNYINILRSDINANLYIYQPANYVAVTNATPYSIPHGNVALAEYFRIAPDPSGNLVMSQVPFTQQPNAKPLP